MDPYFAESIQLRSSESSPAAAVVVASSSHSQSHSVPLASACSPSPPNVRIPELGPSFSTLTSPITSSSPFVTLDRNWNQEFQEILSSISDDYILREEAKFQRLSRLANDFAYAAKTYGAIIISEQFVHDDYKLIKPSKNLGGFAGGKKYECAGIVFKFAVDVILPNGRKLYGSDEAAMRAASLDLLGVITMFPFHSIGVHVPLMCVIDYMGFRLTATSKLPINKSTLIYGSDNACENVFASDVNFNSKIRQISEVLKIKPHRVMQADSSSVELCGPFDLEGHLGLDGRYYCLDFSRLCPPQPPNERGGVLHRLFRPEFMRENPVPLSPNAYGGEVADSAPASQQELRVAFDRLLRETIPSFVQDMLSAGTASIIPIPKAVNDLGLFIGQLHSRGINVRHLGRLFQHLRPRVLAASGADRLNTTQTETQTESSHAQYWCRWLLVEMLARTFKAELRLAFRQTMSLQTSVCEEPYRHCLVRIVNQRFGSNAYADLYWSNQVLPQLVDRFSYETALSEFGMTTDSSQICGIQFRELVRPLFADVLTRFFSLVYVKVDAEFLRQLNNQDDQQLSVIRYEAPMDHTHLISIEPRIKQTNIVPYATGTALLTRAVAARRRSGRRGNEERHQQLYAESTRLGQLAKQQFIASTCISRADFASWCNMAFLMEFIFGDQESANRAVDEALRWYPKHVRSLYYKGRYFRKAKPDAAIKCFRLAIESSNRNHINSMKDLATLLFRRGDGHSRRAVELKDVDDLCERVLTIAPTNILTIQLYSQKCLKYASSASDVIKALRLLVSAASSVDGNSNSRNEVRQSVRCILATAARVLFSRIPSKQAVPQSASSKPSWSSIALRNSSPSQPTAPSGFNINVTAPGKVAEHEFESLIGVIDQFIAGPLRGCPLVINLRARLELKRASPNTATALTLANRTAWLTVASAARSLVPSLFEAISEPVSLRAYSPGNARAHINLTDVPLALRPLERLVRCLDGATGSIQSSSSSTNQSVSIDTWQRLLTSGDSDYDMLDVGFSNGKQETTLFPNDEVCMILDYAKLLKDSGLADQAFEILSALCQLPAPSVAEWAAYLDCMSDSSMVTSAFQKALQDFSIPVLQEFVDSCERSSDKQFQTFNKYRVLLCRYLKHLQSNAMNAELVAVLQLVVNKFDKIRITPRHSNAAVVVCDCEFKSQCQCAHLALSKVETHASALAKMLTSDSSNPAFSPDTRPAAPGAARARNSTRRNANSRASPNINAASMNSSSPNWRSQSVSDSCVNVNTSRPSQPACSSVVPPTSSSTFCSPPAHVGGYSPVDAAMVMEADVALNRSLQLEFDDNSNTRSAQHSL